MTNYAFTGLIRQIFYFLEFENRTEVFEWTNTVCWSCHWRTNYVMRYFFSLQAIEEISGPFSPTIALPRSVVISGIADM